MQGLLKAFRPFGAPPATASSGALPDEKNEPEAPANKTSTYRQGEAEDDLDLQAASLEYMFHRCAIATSEAFNEGPAAQNKDKKDPAASRSKMDSALEAIGLGEADADTLIEEEDEAEESGADKTKPVLSKALDAQYDKPAFERALANDKHRILVDWKKNKFRAMCILSGTPPALQAQKPVSTQPKPPASKLQQPNTRRRVGPPAASSVSQQIALATGGAIIKQLAPGYAFITLSPRASELVYIKTLSECGLYSEHYVAPEARRRLVKEALDVAKRRKWERFCSATGARHVSMPNRKMASVTDNINTNTFDKNDRVVVITEYLRSLAVQVQVDRLYRALYRERIKKGADEHRPNMPPSRIGGNSAGSRLLHGASATAGSGPGGRPKQPITSIHSTSASVIASYTAAAAAAGNSGFGEHEKPARPSSFVVATPSHGVSVSPSALPHSHEGKYYLKSKAPEIPYNHRNSGIPVSTGKVSPTHGKGGPVVIASQPPSIHGTLSVAKNSHVYANSTSKPRIPSANATASSGNGPTSPVRAPSRAASYNTPSSIPVGLASPPQTAHHAPLRKRPSNMSLHPSATPILAPPRATSSGNIAAILAPPPRTTSSGNIPALAGQDRDRSTSPSRHQHHSRAPSRSTSRPPSRPSSRPPSRASSPPAVLTDGEPLRGGVGARRVSAAGIMPAATPLRGSTHTLSHKSSSGTLLSSASPSVAGDVALRAPAQKPGESGDRIRKEVMEQARRAVGQRLEREGEVLAAERKVSRWGLDEVKSGMDDDGSYSDYE